MLFLRHLIYPLFGVIVLGSYGFYLGTARDLGASSVESRQMPPGSRQASGGYRVAPIFWYGGIGGGK